MDGDWGVDVQWGTERDWGKDMGLRSDIDHKRNFLFQALNGCIFVSILTGVRGNSIVPYNISVMRVPLGAIRIPLTISLTIFNSWDNTKISLDICTRALTFLRPLPRESCWSSWEISCTPEYKRCQTVNDRYPQLSLSSCLAAPSPESFTQRAHINYTIF